MGKNSQWGSILTFILAMIGLTIGIGNIWRFSYVLYSNGGGSFFIPYIIAIAIIGIPFLIVEYGLGYSLKKSFSKLMYDIRPEFEIIAWMVVLFVFIVVTYYMVILAWDIVYLFSSFTFAWGSNPHVFFIEFVGGSSNGSLSSFIFPTFISIIFLWILFWIVSNRDVDDGIGKVSSILMPLLFFIMILIVFYSFTLPGFEIGISTLLNPNWNALFEIDIWLAAFGQIIFTLSIGQAMVYTYATYLPKNTRLTDDVFLVVLTNSFYEIFIAIGTFSILGYMSLVSSMQMEDLVSQGTGLIFIVFPEIFNAMGPIGHIIAPLLFISIFFAGITSSFALFEPLLSSVCDKFALSRRKGVTILSIIACLISLAFVTGMSSYLVEVVDKFVNQFGILILIGAQAIIFGWFYGIEKALPSLNELSRIKVGKTWIFIVKYIIPLAVIVVWVYGIVDLFSESNYFEIIVDLIIVLAVVISSIALTKFKKREVEA